MYPSPISISFLLCNAIFANAHVEVFEEKFSKISYFYNEFFSRKELKFIEALCKTYIWLLNLICDKWVFVKLVRDTFIFSIIDDATELYYTYIDICAWL
jgi:hypothetical protein